MATIQCLSCGNIEDSNAAFCRECGAPLTASAPSAVSKKCEECGRPLEPDSAFCPQCGCPVGNASSAAASLKVGQEYAPPSPIRKNINPPPAAAIAVNAAMEKKRKRFAVYNIIGLLLMIYPTVLFLGKLIVIELNGEMWADFSFGEFSDITAKFKDFVNSVDITSIETPESVYGTILNSLYDTLNFIDLLKYAFGAIFLYSAYKFISGLFDVNKGKLLLYPFFAPIIYSGVVIIVLRVLLIKSVNELAVALEENFKCIMSEGVVISLFIGVISVFFYGIISLVEGDSIQDKVKTKK